MEQIIDYFQTNWMKYLYLLWQHIEISFLVVIIAILVAVPLGYWCSGNPRIQTMLEGLFGVLRIIPSLAILIACIPVIGTGMKTAMVALIVLAIPPILINTTQAFATLDTSVIEAARGMGMTPIQCLTQVKLAMAFPLIFTGIRTAAIEVIASATLATYIGAGGLGSIIFTGLGLMRTDLLVIGGASVAVLSMVTGWILDLIYKKKTNYLTY